MTKSTQKGGSPTVITDANIRDLVKKYIINKRGLPEDLRTVPIGNWDVSRVTDMNRLFTIPSPNLSMDPRVLMVLTEKDMYLGYNFNEDISQWDVSNVTNMDSMFVGVFNQPIGAWNVSKVTSMNSMFFGAISFNQPIGSWNVSNVTNMNSMFRNAKSFNQPVGSWNVSNVKDMAFMFGAARSFNQPIGSWDVSKVEDMKYMFDGATVFNQPIGSWNVSNVKNMTHMFEATPSFNQPLNQWNIQNVRNVEKMFSGSAMIPSNYPLVMLGVPEILKLFITKGHLENYNEMKEDFSTYAQHIDLMIKEIKPMLALVAELNNEVERTIYEQSRQDVKVETVETLMNRCPEEIYRLLNKILKTLHDDFGITPQNAFNKQTIWSPLIYDPVTTLNFNPSFSHDLNLFTEEMTDLFIQLNEYKHELVASPPTAETRMSPSRLLTVPSSASISPKRQPTQSVPPTPAPLPTTPQAEQVKQIEEVEPESSMSIPSTPTFTEPSTPMSYFSFPNLSPEPPPFEPSSLDMMSSELKGSPSPEPSSPLVAAPSSQSIAPSIARSPTPILSASPPAEPSIPPPSLSPAPSPSLSSSPPPARTLMHFSYVIAIHGRTLHGSRFEFPIENELSNISYALGQYQCPSVYPSYLSEVPGSEQLLTDPNFEVYRDVILGVHRENEKCFAVKNSDPQKKGWVALQPMLFTFSSQEQESDEIQRDGGIWGFLFWSDNTIERVPIMGYQEMIQLYKLDRSYGTYMRLFGILKEKLVAIKSANALDPGFEVNTLFFACRSGVQASPPLTLLERVERSISEIQAIPNQLFKYPTGATIIDYVPPNAVVEMFTIAIKSQTNAMDPLGYRRETGGLHFTSQGCFYNMLVYLQIIDPEQGEIMTSIQDEGVSSNLCINLLERRYQIQIPHAYIVEHLRIKPITRVDYDLTNGISKLLKTMLLFSQLYHAGPQYTEGHAIMLKLYFRNRPDLGHWVAFTIHRDDLLPYAPAIPNNLYDEEALIRASQWRLVDPQGLSINSIGGQLITIPLAFKKFNNLSELMLEFNSFATRYGSMDLFYVALPAGTPQYGVRFDPSAITAAYIPRGGLKRFMKTKKNRNKKNKMNKLNKTKNRKGNKINKTKYKRGVNKHNKTKSKNKTIRRN